LGTSNFRTSGVIESTSVDPAVGYDNYTTGSGDETNPRQLVPAGHGCISVGIFAAIAHCETNEVLQFEKWRTGVQNAS
jgi:hypothetical protein